MNEFLITLILIYVAFTCIRCEVNSRRRLKIQNQRLADIEKLRRRIDRAVEMDNTIIQMFLEGDVANANELAKVSFDERNEIEKELIRLDISRRQTKPVTYL